MDKGVKKDCIVMAIALLVVTGGIFYLVNEYENHMPLLNSKASKEDIKAWIVKRIEKKIESGLQQGEKYAPLKWDGSFCKNRDGGGTFSNGILVPDNDWETVRYTHVFQIMNKEGAVSYFRKSITFDRNWDIIDYSDAVKLSRDVLKLNSLLNFYSDQDFYGLKKTTDDSQVSEVYDWVKVDEWRDLSYGDGSKYILYKDRNSEEMVIDFVMRATTLRYKCQKYTVKSDKEFLCHEPYDTPGGARGDFYLKAGTPIYVIQVGNGVQAIDDNGYYDVTGLLVTLDEHRARIFMDNYAAKGRGYFMLYAALGK